MDEQNDVVVIRKVHGFWASLRIQRMFASAFNLGLGLVSQFQSFFDLFCASSS